jgi:hypothetical protein
MSRMSSAGSLVCATSDDREPSGRAIGDLRHCAAGGHRPRLELVQDTRFDQGSIRGLAPQAVGTFRSGCDINPPQGTYPVPDRSRRSRSVHARSEPSRTLAGYLPHLQREDGLAFLENVAQTSGIGPTRRESGKRGARWRCSITRFFPQASMTCGSPLVIVRHALAGQSTGSDRSTNHAGCATRADSAGERSTADCEPSIQWGVTAAPLARSGNASSCCRASFGASAPERKPATNPCRTVG